MGAITRGLANQVTTHYDTLGQGQELIGGGMISSDVASADVTWTAGTWSAIEIRVGGITDTYDYFVGFQIRRGTTWITNSTYNYMFRGMSSEADADKLIYRASSQDRVPLIVKVQTDSERTNHGSSMGRCWIQHNIKTSRPYFVGKMMGGKGGGFDTTAWGGGVLNNNNSTADYISGIRFLGETGNLSYLDYAVYGMYITPGTIPAS